MPDVTDVDHVSYHLVSLTCIMSHVMHASTGVDTRVQALDSLLPYLQANSLRQPRHPIASPRVCFANRPCCSDTLLRLLLSNMHRVLSGVVECDDLWHRD